jgi:hypothetical protein
LQVALKFIKIGQNTPPVWVGYFIQAKFLNKLLFAIEDDKNFK